MQEMLQISTGYIFFESVLFLSLTFEMSSWIADHSAAIADRGQRL
jgi:hypothetical protein